MLSLLLKVNFLKEFYVLVFYFLMEMIFENVLKILTIILTI